MRHAMFLATAAVAGVGVDEQRFCRRHEKWFGQQAAGLHAGLKRDEAVAAERGHADRSLDRLPVARGLGGVRRRALPIVVVMRGSGVIDQQLVASYDNRLRGGNDDAGVPMIGGAVGDKDCAVRCAAPLDAIATGGQLHVDLVRGPFVKDPWQAQIEPFVTRDAHAIDLRAGAVFGVRLQHLFGRRPIDEVRAFAAREAAPLDAKATISDILL